MPMNYERPVDTRGEVDNHGTEKEHQRLLGEFLAHWETRVRSGQNSEFDRTELMCLDIFAHWLDEHEQGL